MERRVKNSCRHAPTAKLQKQTWISAEKKGKTSTCCWETPTFSPHNGKKHPKKEVSIDCLEGVLSVGDTLTSLPEEFKGREPLSGGRSRRFILINPADVGAQDGYPRV